MYLSKSSPSRSIILRAAGVNYITLYYIFYIIFTQHIHYIALYCVLRITRHYLSTKARRVGRPSCAPRAWPILHYVISFILYLHNIYTTLHSIVYYVLHDIIYLQKLAEEADQPVRTERASNYLFL